MRRASVAKIHPRDGGEEVESLSFPTSWEEYGSTTHRRRKRKRMSETCSCISMGKYAMALLVLLSIGIGLSLVDQRQLMVIAPGNHKMGAYSQESNLSVSAGLGVAVTGRRGFQKFSNSAPICTPIDQKQVSYTLVTQFSIDRLWMMEYHCKRWGSSSPISVAVLTNQTRSQTLDSILRLGCDPDQLTVQTLELNKELEIDYPVNLLRKMALSAVETSHVMYVDIDFWESGDLHQLLHLASVKKALAQDAKLALVVPAFQLHRQCREYRDCSEENIPKMPIDFHAMLDTMVKGNGSPFDPTNRGGHGSTLYAEWIHQEPGDLLDIPCIRSNRYEPYLAFRYCRDLPPFQLQFSGYGKNKMTWVMQLRRSGYTFSQLGSAFVVHYPHLDSVSRMEWNQGPREIQPFRGEDGKLYKRRPQDISNADWISFKRGQVDATFVEFRKWLQSEIRDETKVPMCEDKEDDDARLWIDRTNEDSA